MIPKILNMRRRRSVRSPFCFMALLMNTVELNPGIVDFMITITARLRWDEANELPQTRVGTLTLNYTSVTNIARYSSCSGNRYYSYLGVLLKSRRRNWLLMNRLLVLLMAGRSSQPRPLIIIYSVRKSRRSIPHILRKPRSSLLNPITTLFFRLSRIDPAGRMDPTESCHLQ